MSEIIKKIITSLGVTIGNSIDEKTHPIVEDICELKKDLKEAYSRINTLVLIINCLGIAVIANIIVTLSIIK